MSVNLGSVYENAVAIELKAHSHELYYYDNKHNGEVDFLIDDYDLLSCLPIEVKSGRDYTIHSALDKFVNNKDYNSYLFRFPGGSSGGRYSKIKSEAQKALKAEGLDKYGVSIELLPELTKKPSPKAMFSNPILQVKAGMNSLFLGQDFKTIDEYGEKIS